MTYTGFPFFRPIEIPTHYSGIGDMNMSTIEKAFDIPEYMLEPKQEPGTETNGRFCATCLHSSKLNSFSPDDESGYRCFAPESVTLDILSPVTGQPKKEYILNGMCSFIRKEEKHQHLLMCGPSGLFWKQRSVPEPSLSPIPAPQTYKEAKKKLSTIELDDF